MLFLCDKKNHQKHYAVAPTGSSPYAGTVDQKSVETQLKAQAAAACVRAWFCSGGPTVTRVWTPLYAVLLEGF